MAATQFANLSDLDLLGKLIGIKESRRLYRGSLQPIFSSIAGERVPERCAVARELVMRWLSEEVKSQCLLTGTSAVSDYLRIHFAGQEHETFVTLFLDAQNRLIKASEQFRGTLTQTSVYPREVVKAALRENAAAVIFAHNHPSGVAEPSNADDVLTRTLKAALALVDVRVLDHFVVAGATVISFSERGLI